MSDKRLFVKLQTENILVEQGRQLYAVLYAFSLSGYRIDLFDSLNRERLGRYGKMAYEIKSVRVMDRLPDDIENCIYLYDKEDRSLAGLNWWKKVQVRDDLFSPYCCKNPMIMPYGMYPKQTSPQPDQRLDVLRANNRKLRIFFSGDTKDYGRNRIQYPAPKLPRLEIVNTLRERIADDVILVQDEATLNVLRDNDSQYSNHCVIMDTSRVWVEVSAWLDTLADADFFLSPPGIVMPMCHNLIEAMAVGTIPITNYPEWMRPNLVHMENCIVFDDEDDLIRKVKLALSLNESEIARMRANVIDYYRKHLDPRIFVKELEARQERDVTVLLYTENNVRDNWARLNRHSVLMRHEAPTGKLSKTKCLISILFARFHNVFSHQ
jgi:hypothetical protein